MGTTRESTSISEALAVYLDPRMLLLLALGFSSGLPRLLVYSTLTFWLVDVGMKIETVTLFAATAVPYNFKFAWAPILDRFQLPFLAKRLGGRRSWILVLQLGIAAAIAALAFTDPGVDPIACAIAAIVVATLSASQDIVIDAYRVDLLDDEEQAAGAAMAVYGYRIGMLVAGAGALYIVTIVESWPLTYLAMAGSMAACIVATVLAPKTPAEREVAECEQSEPTEDSDAHWTKSLAVWFFDAVVGPFRAFAERPAWGAILVFVVLFKLGDALAGTVTNPFLDAIGFDKITIANVGKTFGLVASMVGVGLGGVLVKRVGIFGALWASGILQLVSNLVFVVQASLGADASFLAVTIGFENLSGGLGTAAFVAYLSGLCDRRYTATQYALLTAVSSSLQTVLSTPTGTIVAAIGWQAFYAATAVAALPGLAVLWWVSRAARRAE